MDNDDKISQIVLGTNYSVCITKRKKMKPKILKLSTVALLFLFITVGCQKDNETIKDTGITGKWQLIHYPESCVGFGDVQLEITNDSVFKRYADGEITLESTFSITEGTMGYDTIFFHNPNVDFSYNFLSFLGNDTLQLDMPILTSISMCNYYKRKE